MRGTREPATSHPRVVAFSLAAFPKTPTLDAIATDDHSSPHSPSVPVGPTSRKVTHDGYPGCRDVRQAHAGAFRSHHAFSGHALSASIYHHPLFTERRRKSPSAWGVCVVTEAVRVVHDGVRDVKHTMQTSPTRGFPNQARTMPHTRVSGANFG